LEAINHYEAIGFIRTVKGLEDLSKRNLLDIHSLVLKSIDSESAGVYRKSNVKISGSQHMPPDALDIPQKCRLTLNFTLKRKTHAPRHISGRNA
jgi:hypothetical protein